MRVISGSVRGLKLRSLDGEETRPTLDRVKEALFSMLFGRTMDAVGLDLFAGSGALGIELISRGAKRCTFVDSSSDAIEVVESNIRSARFEDASQVVLADALSFISSVEESYDIIFLDPPYASGLYDKVLGIIKSRGRLNDGGIIVCECNKELKIDTSGFVVIKDKSYGKVRLLVLEEA